MTTATEKAFNILATFPDGLTCFELMEFLETEQEKRSASARLSQFVNEGLATREGVRHNPGTGLPGVVYKPTGVPYSQRQPEIRIRPRKRKRPTDTELVELRRWKADAIKRFPQLGVDPIVLTARDHVASILRSEGNEAKAALVDQGELDDGETMRIVLSVLRRREEA